MKAMLKGFLSVTLLLTGAIFYTKADDNNSCSSTSSCNNTNNNDSCDSSCGSTDSTNNNCKQQCNVSGYVNGTRTHFSLRGQEINSVSRLTATTSKQHRCDVPRFNGTVDGTFRVSKTLNGKNIARYLFGKNELTYGNECDGTFDIYSVNFGTTASGKVKFCPEIKNFIGDINIWLGMDEFLCGLWAMIDVPITYTRWTLGMQDTNTFNPLSINAEFAPDLVSTTTVLVPYPNLKSAWADDRPFGDAPRMACGRICGRQSNTGISGIRFDLGYDIIRNPSNYFGISALFITPTGNRPSDEFLFNAVSGSQFMWQAGVGLVAGYRLWNSCDDNQNLSIYFDGTITHLFKAKQARLFALKKKDGTPNPLSSFLLLKHFDPNTGAFIKLQRAVNVLCCETRINARIQTDLSLMLQYDLNHFSSGLGWNFWLRDTERVHKNSTTNNNNGSTCNDNDCVIPANTYGIKGSTLVTDTDTMSNATIGNCGAVDATTVFLTTADIDKCSVLNPRAFSNKIFAWVGYNWSKENWQPYVAFETGFEFGNQNKAADQWEIMFKGGVAY